MQQVVDHLEDGRVVNRPVSREAGREVVYGPCVDQYGEAVVALLKKTSVADYLERAAALKCVTTWRETVMGKKPGSGIDVLFNISSSASAFNLAA